MTFDGIPFEDTNSPTHHSWANFPSGWTDRRRFRPQPRLGFGLRPHQFRRIDPTCCRRNCPDPDIRATVSYGSWNTRLLQLDAR